MRRRDVADADALFASERPGDEKLVPDVNHAVGFGRLAVHVYLAAFAGALRLGPRLEQTGDVEPDVHPNVGRRLGAGTLEIRLHWEGRRPVTPFRSSPI